MKVGIGARVREGIGFGGWSVGRHVKCECARRLVGRVRAPGVGSRRLARWRPLQPLFAGPSRTVAVPLLLPQVLVVLERPWMKALLLAFGGRLCAVRAGEGRGV